MNKRSSFLWIRIGFMLGALGVILYTMSTLKSGTAFKNPNSPMAILLGTSPAPQEERAAKVIMPKPSRTSASESEESQNH